MFWRFVGSAVRFRKRRLLLAFAAMSVAATLATALFTIYSELERRLRSEFASYGPNLIIAASAQGQTIPAEWTASISRQATTVAPILLTSTDFNGTSLTVAAVDFKAQRTLTPYWKVTGAWPATNAECLIGRTLAERLNLRTGSSTPCRITGILETGGPEDNQILHPFSGTQASLIQARVDGGRIEEIRAALQRQFPEATVRIVRDAAHTENSVVIEVRYIFLLIALMVMIVTVLCVTSNFSELVIERAKEIGILKAIGAVESRIASLFLSESILLAILSSLSGYILGVLAAAQIAQNVFAVPFRIQLRPEVFGLTVFVTVAVGILSTILAARSVWNIDPAVVLRSE